MKTSAQLSNFLPALFFLRKYISIFFSGWNLKVRINLSLSFLLFSLIIANGNSQCDVEVSGIFAYCNSFKNNVNNIIPGYFIGFRIKSESGDTLNVVDLA